MIENAGYISAAEVAAIERHRLWHFFPDTLALAIGGWGYTFPVDQQRGEYAQLPEDPSKQRALPPEKIAAFALKQLCRGIIWTYSEPTVEARFVREVLQSARASSRYTALRTNGYMSLEILDSFGPYLDGISLDLRGFGDTAYTRLAGIEDWRLILDVAARAHHHWRCHIEIVTRLHHGVNDNPDELRELVEWISDMLGPYIPWHVLPGDRGVGTAASVRRARQIALENGLQYVYGSENNQVTQCPNCQSVLITREKGVVTLVGIEEGQCKYCDFRPYLRTSIFKRYNEE